MTKKLTALLLCVLLLFTACGDTASSGGEDGVSGISAKGRYMEEKLELPPIQGYVISFKQLKSGALCLYDYDYESGESFLWRSEDNGDSWHPLEYQWLEELKELTILTASFGEDGVYLIHALPFDGDPDELGDAFMEEYAKYTCFMVGDEEGLRDLPFRQWDLNPQNSPSELDTTPDGDLLVGYYFDVAVVDPSDGTVKQTFPLDSAQPGRHVAMEDGNLLTSSASKATLWSMETGDRLEEYVYANSPSEQFLSKYVVRAIARKGDQPGIFYCDDTGLYRILEDGSLTEQLIDGGLNTFGMPSHTVYSLFACDDDTFLMHTRAGGDNYLLRYVYNPDVSRVPGTRLSVYSLEENATIRQAIGLFQQANPDVVVDYTVGITGGNSVTAADAVRTLNTQLLAGTGPDLLVLDGLPLDSYLEKGVLAELSIEELLGSGQFLEGVVRAYEGEQGLCAVPARLLIPYMAGIGTGEITTLEGLADYLAERERPRLDIWLPHLTGIVCDSRAQDWFREDGSLDREAFRDDLEQVHRIVDITDPDREDWLSEGFIGKEQLNYSALSIMSGRTTAALAPLWGLDNLQTIYSTFQTMGRGDVEPFPRENGILFQPRTVLGVTSSGKQQELARELVAITLSLEIQASQLGDGLPVRRDALEANTVKPFSGESNGSISSSWRDPETGEREFVASVELIWPDQAFFDKIMGHIEGASVLAGQNAVVREIIVEEAEPYILGTRTLDQAVDAVENKVNLYLSEQN